MSRQLRPARAPARRPGVTVVIPCHNYGHFLPVALASVLSQEGVEVDAIVIDDASTDGSQDVLRALAAGDQRIRAIVHPTNHGHIATYNEGLAQAQGEYVALLSADDALAPGALARATALMEAHPQVAFVYGFPVAFQDELPPLRTRVRSWTVWPGHEWIACCARSGRNCIQSAEVVMRAGVQHEIGYYDPSLPHSGDLDMWIRAALVGDVGRVNGADQACYRVHPQSMQRLRYAGHMLDLEARLVTFEKALGSAGALPAGTEMLASARRALAASALQYARIAYDNRREDSEPVSEYLAFAERVWPDSRGSRAWRACERVARSRARRGPLRPAQGGVHEVAARTRITIDDLTHRLRWRRWRATGVW